MLIFTPWRSVCVCFLVFLRLCGCHSRLACAGRGKRNGNSLHSYLNWSISTYIAVVPNTLCYFYTKREESLALFGANSRWIADETQGAEDEMGIFLTYIITNVTERPWNERMQWSMIYFSDFWPNMRIPDCIESMLPAGKHGLTDPGDAPS